MAIKKIGIIGDFGASEALLASIKLIRETHKIEVVMVGAGVTNTDSLAKEAIELGCDILIHGDDVKGGPKLEEIANGLKSNPLPYVIKGVDREFVETRILEPEPNKYFNRGKKNWKKN